MLHSQLPALGPTCIHVGADENGLGPVLGPLVVTGVAARFSGPRPRSLGALVGDSKALVSHGNVALGEAWARALLTSLGRPPRTPADILASVSLDPIAELKAPCPGRRGEAAPEQLCWPTDPDSEPFLADEAMVDECLTAIRRWSGERVGGKFARRTPLTIVGLRSSLVCVSRVNQAVRGGRHKFLLDLHEMERVVLALRAQSDPALPLDAVCGKVGGMQAYTSNFGPLSSRLCAIEHEERSLSAYRFPELGRISFVQDADAEDALVGLASLVGKYLREHWMSRIVSYLRQYVTDLPDASGYRDPVTRKFIERTSEVRRRLQVAGDCFERLG